MTRAVIYVEGPVRPSERDVGRQKKLRACRAYCRRMGYDIVKVIATVQPKPNFTDEALRILHESGVDALRAFLAALPHHPEDDADAMVESGEADVKVEFTSIGDSGPFDGHYTPEMQKHLPAPQRLEQASLWELEPPTPEVRQWHQWVDEDFSRRRQGQPTRAAIYVRTHGRTPDDRKAEERQDRYCQGYCRQQGYEVTQVYRDADPTGNDDERPALDHAIRSFDEGRIHVLVALDEERIAEDAQRRAEVQTRMPRIEYARSYAADIELDAFLDGMERVQAVFERRHKLQERSNDMRQE